MKSARLLFAVLAAAAAVGKVAAATAPEPPTRPNILFIFSDDHAYQAISAYGSRLNRTPNLDRIAREGIRFDRCLVTNSICGPSRATILTGKYSHRNGFYNNTNSRFDGSQVTFPKLLRQAGYQTALVGKWHLVSDPTGFDYWDILPGQGRYYNPPMIRNGERLTRKGYVTDIVTDLALDWLKQRDPSRPFVMMCQHKAPHREWSPNLKYLKEYDRRYPEPETLFDDYSGRGKAEQNQDMTLAKTMVDVDVKLAPPPGIDPEQKREWDAFYGPKNEEFRNAKLQGEALVRWRYQRYMHDYLACIASVDESVGRLLDYLKETGRARLVRQALDLRGIAADAVPRPLARSREAGPSQPGPGFQPGLRRDLSGGGRRPRPGGDAGSQPRPAPEGEDALRLADELLLPLLRVSGGPQRGAPLRRGDRPVQAGPLLRAGVRLLGAVRPEEGPPRAEKRLRRPRVCPSAGGAPPRTPSPARRAEAPGPGPARIRPLPPRAARPPGGPIAVS
jgi:hypothetical protein